MRPDPVIPDISAGKPGVEIHLEMLKEMAARRPVNPRIQLDEDGTLDDFYANDVQSVHFEALGEAQWYAVIQLRNGEQWLLNFGAVNDRAKGYARAEID